MGSGNVLIIDDSNFMRLSLKSTINQAFPGFKYFYAKDFPSALGIVASNDISLLLTDYVILGNINGIELLDRLYFLGYDFVSIVLSSMATPDVVTNAVSVGASTFLKKPVDKDKLISVVSKVLSEDELEVQ